MLNRNLNFNLPTAPNLFLIYGLYFSFASHVHVRSVFHFLMSIQIKKPPFSRGDCISRVLIADCSKFFYGGGQAVHDIRGD